MTMLRRILQLSSGRIALGLLTFVLLLAVFGPLLAPYGALQGTDQVLAHPSSAHLLGTDYLGRDVLSRLLVGSPVSVLGAVLVSLIALVVGTIPGILSVYLGSAFEWLSLRFVDTLIALPFLLFAVAMTALLGNGLTQAMITVGILVAPASYRVSRAATLSVARSQYVEAAILAGASTGWIVRKHVWAKVLPPVAIVLSGTMANGLVVVASLTFLGIGVRPPEPTWGGLLASDLAYLSYRPYAPLFPTFLIMITVWAFNLLADAIRDVAGESGRVLLAQRRMPAKRVSAPPKLSKVGADASALRTRAKRDAGEKESSDSDVVLALDDVKIADASTGHELVHGVSFALRRGRTLGIVGESGSGKTLTCRAMLGILPKLFALSGGSITLAGKDLAGFTRDDWNRVHGGVISAVFQDPASYLNPGICVGKQIEEIFRVKKGLRRKAAKAEVLGLFESLALRDPELVFQQFPHELSGGMLQRVLIASAIAQDPQILIADEATTALDVTVQAEILQLLRTLKERTGMALILVSHDLAVVAQLCDEVLVMKAGEVVERGTVEDILYRPKHPYTQLLIEEHKFYGLERFLASGTGDSARAEELSEFEHAS